MANLLSKYRGIFLRRAACGQEMLTLAVLEQLSTQTLYSDILVSFRKSRLRPSLNMQ